MSQPKHNLKKHHSAIRKAFDEMFIEDESEDYPEDEIISKKDHECEEGMTELNGYFICKHCGTNLRKIK